MNNVTTATLREEVAHHLIVEDLGTFRRRGAAQKSLLSTETEKNEVERFARVTIPIFKCMRTMRPRKKNSKESFN